MHPSLHYKTTLHIDYTTQTVYKSMTYYSCKKTVILTKSCFGYIMIIEKGKTLNGYAISVLFMKNNADLWLSGRYFFMEITKSNRTIIKQIMYSLSIAVTSFLGDDGITAQLLHCFKSYLYRIAPTSTLYTIYLYISSKINKKCR